MFQVNDYVVYGSTGVCQVVDISRESFCGQANREYYVLNPVFGNPMEIFIPTDSKVVMRDILSKGEITELIQSMPQIDSEWITDDNSRKATFNEILQSGDQKRIVQLIKMINNRKAALESNGKHLTNNDSETFKTAEKLLCNEFALVLGIQPDQVVSFILEQIPA